MQLLNMIQAAILGLMPDCVLQSTYSWFLRPAKSPHSQCVERCDGSKHQALVQVHGIDCCIACLEVAPAWPMRPPAGHCCSLQNTVRSIHNSATLTLFPLETVSFSQLSYLPVSHTLYFAVFPSQDLRTDLA